MIRQYPNRKSVRNRFHHYGPGTTLFVTFNISQREHLLGKIVNGRMRLSDAGLIVNKQIVAMGELSYIRIHAHVVMPDHVHVLFTILHEESDSRSNAPSSQRVFGQTQSRTCWSVMSQLKSCCTKEVWKSIPALRGRKIWHRGFHVRIVRGSIHRIVQYILNNPQNWGKKKRRRRSRAGG